MNDWEIHFELYIVLTHLSSKTAIPRRKSVEISRKKVTVANLLRLLERLESYFFLLEKSISLAETEPGNFCP